MVYLELLSPFSFLLSWAQQKAGNIYDIKVVMFRRLTLLSVVRSGQERLAMSRYVTGVSCVKIDKKSRHNKALVT